ncbi:hypothetical protein [Hungatella hathewayi]|uniref:hypothetical protein n=1 Tax=Hungatella hathewayi TaxID=154046 RepID=UPI003565DDC2
MGSFEEMLTIMRRQGAPAVNAGIQKAEMTGPYSLKLGDMPLTAEDLMFEDALIHPPEGKTALKAGDTVAIIRMSDTLYWVLGKMVKA